MAKIMCALPMQVTVEILVDTEKGELIDWGLHDMSIDAITDFINSISTALIEAASMPVDENTGVSDVYTINSEGESVKVVDKEQLESYEALLAAQEAKDSTQH